MTNSAGNGTWPRAEPSGGARLLAKPETWLPSGDRQRGHRRFFGLLVPDHLMLDNTQSMTRMSGRDDHEGGVAIDEVGHNSTGGREERRRLSEMSATSLS